MGEPRVATVLPTTGLTNSNSMWIIVYLCTFISNNKAYFSVYIRILQPTVEKVNFTTSSNYVSLLQCHLVIFKLLYLPYTLYPDCVQTLCSSLLDYFH